MKLVYNTTLKVLLVQVSLNKGGNILISRHIGVCLLFKTLSSTIK